MSKKFERRVYKSRPLQSYSAPDVFEATIRIPYELWEAIPGIGDYCMGVLANRATEQHIGRLTFSRVWDPLGFYVVTCDGERDVLPN